MTLFKEMPNHVVVFVGEGKIRVVPVHKVTQTFRLFRLNAGKAPDPPFTELDKLGD